MSSLMNRLSLQSLLAAEAGIAADKLGITIPPGVDELAVLICLQSSVEVGADPVTASPVDGSNYFTFAFYEGEASNGSDAVLVPSDRQSATVVFNDVAMVGYHQKIVVRIGPASYLFLGYAATGIPDGTFSVAAITTTGAHLPA